MGIKYLNSFLKENCPESIKCVSMADMSGKKIAIDISIYLYKYAGDDCLIENIYLMISIFRYYNITPIFVFDGKPPAEKKELLIKRKEDKMKAEKEYNVLKTTLASNINIDDTEKQEILNNMDEIDDMMEIEDDIYMSNYDSRYVYSLEQENLYLNSKLDFIKTLLSCQQDSLLGLNQW